MNMPNLYDFILGPKDPSQVYVREIDTALTIAPTTLLTRLTGAGDTINNITPLFEGLHFILLQCPTLIDINIGVGNVEPSGSILARNTVQLFMFDPIDRKYRYVA